MMRFRILLLALVLNYHLGFSQDSATLILVANKNADVFIDGTNIGMLSPNKPQKFDAVSGEHYLQIISKESPTEEKNEILSLDAGSQKVLKFNFDIKETIQPIPIAELNFDIPGILLSDAESGSNNKPVFYYALDAGDQLIINLKMSNKNGSNSTKVFSYPDGNILFSKDDFQDLNQKINIDKKGIYGISFATSHSFNRNMKMKVTRVPSSKESVQFNTKVVSKEYYNAVTVQSPQAFYINSESNAAFKNGKSKVFIPFTIPENAVKWYYTFSATRDKDKINESLKNFNLLSEITKYLNSKPGISFALNMINQPPGSDYCDIYLIDHENLSLSQNDQAFSYLPVGSRVNYKSGTVEVKEFINTPMYLAINNPDFSHGINVSIEIVAIVKETQLEMAENQ
ncbi:hypothetical protein LVD15_22855 [Fulvivirga maritima]|uniref:hypothetical protein n=1 Tax=Fulvivirga maritima TaxID=2904247 RepID=UPI001F1FFD04|nr:hypothetical protein [Fulvivirga maritima]UII26114.1 hypothetical protein LVD15_22855 [Fulvivirga maritima]